MLFKKKTKNRTAEENERGENGRDEAEKEESWREKVKNSAHNDFTQKSESDKTVYCLRTVRPMRLPEPNVSFAYMFDDIKWNLWIEPGTPHPTLMADAFDDYYPVGAYEGARYLSSGIYRPAPNCMMRSLNHRYCDVCREAMVQGFYGYVEPIDGVGPAGCVPSWWWIEAAPTSYRSYSRLSPCPP